MLFGNNEGGYCRFGDSGIVICHLIIVVIIIVVVIIVIIVIITTIIITTIICIIIIMIIIMTSLFLFTPVHRLAPTVSATHLCLPRNSEETIRNSPNTFLGLHTLKNWRTTISRMGRVSVRCEKLAHLKGIQREEIFCFGGQWGMRILILYDFVQSASHSQGIFVGNLWTPRPRLTVQCARWGHSAAEHFASDSSCGPSGASGSPTPSGATNGPCRAGDLSDGSTLAKWCVSSMGRSTTWGGHDLNVQHLNGSPPREMVGHWRRKHGWSYPQPRIKGVSECEDGHQNKLTDSRTDRQIDGHSSVSSAQFLCNLLSAGWHCFLQGGEWFIHSWMLTIRYLFLSVRPPTYIVLVAYSYRICPKLMNLWKATTAS